MAESVVKTKFELPITKRLDWRNNRLWKEFDSIITYPVTIVQAPLGYGKTMNLAQYLKHTFDEQNLYWYNLVIEDNDFVSFWTNLEYLFYGASENTYDNNSFYVINRLINFLHDHLENDSILIFDNYHLITSKEIRDSLNYFLKLLPNKLHIVFVSREEIDDPQIDIMKINKKILLVDQKNLSLSRNEIERFLLVQHYIQLSPTKIDQIFYYTEGWIIIIDYIAELLYNESMEVEEIFNKKAKKFNILFKYFRTEILNNEKLNKNMIEFLLKTSILEELDPIICDKVLDRDDSMEILNHLKRLGIPIKANNDGKNHYNRFLHYYLNKRAAEKYEIKKIHHKALEVFREANLIEGEIYHLLSLNNELQIINLVKLNATQWIEHDRYDLLKKCLSVIPEYRYKEHPLLYFYRGDLFFLEDKLELALKTYKQALTIVEETGNDSLVIKLLLRLSRTYFSVHSIYGFEYIKKLEKYKQEIPEQKNEEFLSYKILMEIIKGNVKEVHYLLSQLQICGGNLDQFNAFTAFVEGNLLKTIKIIKKIEKRKEKDHFIQHLHIMISLFMGDKYKALELIWKNGRQSSGIIELLYMGKKLTLQQILGSDDRVNYEKKYLKLLTDINNSILRNSWHYRELIISFLNWNANYGNPDISIQLGERKLAEIDNNQDIFFKAHLHHGLGINYYFKSNFVEAKKHFTIGLEINEKLGTVLNKVVSLYWLVLSNFRMGIECDDFIRELLKLSNHYNYEFLFLKPNILTSIDPNVFIPILLQARKKSIEEEYINKLLLAMGLLEIDQHPGYSLRIQAFGSFQLFRGSERISEEDWERSKSKELFMIILVNYGKKLSREKLYSLLWPDKIDKIAKQNFYVAFSTLNKLLEPARKSNQQTCFIESDKSMYGLTNEFTYCYDVARFEEFIEKGKKSKDEEIRINYFQEAIYVYKGNFLQDISGIEWVMEERERLKNIFLQIAIEVMEYYYQQEKYQFCIEIAGQIQMIDRYVDELYLYKMKSLYILGKKGMVAKTFQECNLIFRNELGVEPSSIISEFYQQISTNNKVL